MQVSNGSQIVILEARKKVGLRLARALQSQGQAKSYILQVRACSQPDGLLALLGQVPWLACGQSKIRANCCGTCIACLIG